MAYYQLSSTDTVSSSTLSSRCTAVSMDLIVAAKEGRLGFPAPLPRSSTEWRPADDGFPSLELVQAVNSLLSRHKIEYHNTLYVSRQPSSSESEYRPTILIPAVSTSDDSWYILLRDIKEYLVQNSLPQVCAEIYDPVFFRLPAHFPVEETHPIVQIWPRLADDIVQIVEPKLCSSISCVRRGHEAEPGRNPVTIVLTSEYPAKLASESKQTILYRMRHYGLEGIEIAYVEVENILDADPSGGPRAFPVTNELSMGCGIGLEGDAVASATLGGKLVVSLGGTDYQVGVTNFHVVCENPAIKGRLENQPFHPNNPNNPAVGLVVPSDYDFYSALQTTKHCVDIQANALASFNKKFGSDDESVDEDLKDRNARIKEAKGAMETRFKKLNAFNRQVGHLWSSSSFGANFLTGMPLGWALISLNPQRSFSNTLPKDNELGQIKPYDARWNAVEFPRSGQVEEVSPCTLGTLVFKWGRTSGLRGGRVNALEPRVNVGGRFLSAYQVVGMSSDVEAFFGREGDLGSWVIDLKGRWVGLLFSCPKVSMNGDAYVLDAPTVVSDIERVTGGTVTLGGA
ncbi:hypothetical protein FQN55_005051 [Onygenales sp. PD_40]|nr:hypothetical protein FQN55_005051 [Onygenales sp. PD_40]